MNNKGFRIGLVVALVLLTGYYLYPTARLYALTNGAPAAGTPARLAYDQTNGETMRGLQERAIKLGLDLQGGMSTTMEVRVDELVRALANDTDPAFNAVMADAQRAAATSDNGFVDLFVDAFEQRDANARLSRYFRSDAGGITRRSTNADVRTYLNAQAADAVDRAIEIVRQRVDRFGVAEPSIVKKGTSRISVELPGVDDPERVRRLLRGTARLEFHLMGEPEELQRSLSGIVAFFNAETPPAQAAADSARTAAATDSVAAIAATDSASRARADSAAIAATQPSANNPFLRIFTPIGDGARFGVVALKDTAAFNRMIARPEVRALLPSKTSLLYDARTSGENNDQLLVLAVRDEVELSGDALEEANVDFDEANRATVSMTMNSEGARAWSRITGANINKPIAIVLDDYVVSYPNVINRITGGRSQITGLESREEATDIVTVLKSGSLPAPVRIIEERTVGPSLGAESVRGGLLSFIVGFVVVAVFLLLWYRTGGVIAIIALVFNIVFLFGVMAAFKATLTLPGIAGIVLTLGMAVDANVLVFERMREELNLGRPFRQAVESGYTNALSAILDSNITTFFTGAILYSFGVGPVQGFAVTLMAGILTSLFSTLIITRLIFEYLVFEKNRAISIG